MASPQVLRDELLSAIADALGQCHAIRSSIDDDATYPVDSLKDSTQTIVESLTALHGRVEGYSLSVLVAGLLKSGKSSLINSLLSALCSPIDDDAATSVLLTAVEDTSERRDFSLSTISGRELERGGPRAIQTRVQQINGQLRSDDLAESEETELLLRMPPRAYSRDGLSLHIVDSPGVNEDQSPNIRQRWLQAVASADVFVMVVPYSPSGSRDEGDLWRQLADELPRHAIENLVLFINKYDLAIVNPRDKEAHRLRTKQARATYVRKATNGRIDIDISHVFLGCARNAMIARTILELSTDGESELDTEAFVEEHEALIGLVRHVFLKRRNRVDLSSAHALHSVEDWTEVLEGSGFNQLDAFLRTRARVCAVAHVRKLLTEVQSYCNRVQQLTRLGIESVTGAERSEASRLADNASANWLVGKYFSEETQEEDDACCVQIRQSLKRLAADICLELAEIRNDSVFAEIPERLDPAQSDELVRIVETFRDKVHAVVNNKLQLFGERVGQLTQRRRELRRSFREPVEQIIEAHGIAMPNDFFSLNEDSGSGDDSAEQFLALLLSRIEDFGRLDVEQLLLIARRVTKPALAAGDRFAAEGDFAQNPQHDARLSGHWNWHEQTCMLGNREDEFVATVNIDPTFVGQHFVLKLEHLTTNEGDRPRAAVAVTINGTTVRTAFVPLASGQMSNTNVGSFSYVTDRWFLAPEWIQAGDNVLKIAYVDGSSHYWLKRWSLSASVPPSEEELLSRDDVLTLLTASAIAILGASDDHDLQLEQIVTTTSPAGVRENASERCAQLLDELARSSRDRLESLVQHRAMLSQIAEQSERLKGSTRNAVIRLAQLTQTGQRA